MTVLVTGGAGYIGSHVSRLLTSSGVDVVVADDLTEGIRERLGPVPLLELDLADPRSVDVLAHEMSGRQVTAVIHLAARKRVDQSVARPAWYYAQNVGSLAHVLEAMERAHVPSLVFSSSAAVYGEPAGGLVTEDAALAPINPYGRTKLIGEWMVRDAARAWGLKAVSLRYFNVAGAGWPDLGDDKVVNLVSMLLDRATRGQRPVVFGSDYPTPDGTCVRDYVHVMDLARAHLAAWGALEAGTPCRSEMNVGTGRGSSVLDVVNALGTAMGTALVPDPRPRRPGDPSTVVADVSAINKDVGWSARLGLAEIVATALEAWSVGPRPADHSARAVGP